MSATDSLIDPEPDTPATSTRIVHRNVAERAETGRQARAACTRASHARLEPGDRDPVALLQEQAASRVPELLPIRVRPHARVPLHLLPGSCGGDGARPRALALSSGLEVQLCGDAHLANFGGFASPERDLVFDLNDFDETLPARSSGMSSGSRRASRSRLGIGTVLTPNARRSYRSRSVSTGRRCDSSPGSGTWTSGTRDSARRSWWRSFAPSTTTTRRTPSSERPRRPDEGQPPRLQQADPPGRRRAAHRLRPAADRPDRGPRPGDLGPGRPRGSGALGLPRLPEDPSSDRRRLLEQFRFVDVARKVVGVGSVGTRCWIVLLLGRDKNDPLFMQIKEAERSVLEPYLHQPLSEPRPARGRGPAPDASGMGHLSRLVSDDRPRRPPARLLLPAALGLEDLDQPRDDSQPVASSSTAMCAAGRSPAHTRARATGSRSASISARARSSTRRSRLRLRLRRPERARL